MHSMLSLGEDILGRFSLKKSAEIKSYSYHSRIVAIFLGLWQSKRTSSQAIILVI